MNQPNTPQAQATEPDSIGRQPSIGEMQAAVQQLAQTQAALRQCLADLIGASALTWR